MERVLGPALGDFARSPQEAHGHSLGSTLSAIEAGRVRLDDGALLDAELVLVGIGVRPRLDLAQQAGLAIDCRSAAPRRRQRGTSLSGRLSFSRSWLGVSSAVAGPGSTRPATGRGSPRHRTTVSWPFGNDPFCNRIAAVNHPFWF
jgi:hypothetical protein